MCVSECLSEKESQLLSEICDNFLTELSRKSSLTDSEKEKAKMISEINMKIICNTETANLSPCNEFTKANNCLVFDNKNKLENDQIISHAYQDTSCQDTGYQDTEAWYTTILKTTLDVVDGIPYVGRTQLVISDEEVIIFIEGYSKDFIYADYDYEGYEIVFTNLGGIEDFLVTADEVEMDILEYIDFLNNDLYEVLKKTL